MKHPPTQIHNYLRKIADLQAVGALRPSSEHTVDVRHDDWCDIYQRRFCNCDPEIILRDGIHPPLQR